MRIIVDLKAETAIFTYQTKATTGKEVKLTPAFLAPFFQARYHIEGATQQAISFYCESAPKDDEPQFVAARIIAGLFPTSR